MSLRSKNLRLVQKGQPVPRDFEYGDPQTETEVVQKYEPDANQLEWSDETRTKVLVASPMGDLCHSFFMNSMVALACYTLTQSSRVIDLQFVQVGTSILPFSRHLLVARALETKVDWLFTVDSDMRFPPDALIRLLRHDRDIVGINAMSRRPPYRCTAQKENGDELITNEYSSGIEKVGRMGLGLLLIRTEVFRKLEPPWFEFRYLPEKGVFRGEDYCFFDKAVQAGYEFYVDHDLSRQVTHLGQFEYSPLNRPQSGG